MSHHKIQQLAIKFAEKVEHIAPAPPLYLGDDENFHNQRVKLESFFYDLYSNLRSALTEIEGDLAVLKHKKIEPGVLKTLGRVFHQINNLTKQVNPQDPYQAVKDLSAWFTNPGNKLIVDNLNFIINTFLKQQADAAGGQKIQNASAKGLTNLMNTVQKAQDYMASNPLLPDPREAITVPPPALLNESTKVDRNAPANHNKETVPGLYQSMLDVQNF